MCDVQDCSVEVKSRILAQLAQIPMSQVRFQWNRYNKSFELFTGSALMKSNRYTENHREVDKTVICVKKSKCLFSMFNTLKRNGAI